MGYFSWMLADKNNEKALKIDRKAYVCCPDGTQIFELCYDGFGEFDGHDIYELGVDWNKEYLSEENLLRPKIGENTSHKRYIELYDNYSYEARRLRMFLDGASDLTMAELFGDDWKRLIGISVACYEFQNEALKYPIKITSKPCDYNGIPASKRDPNQGC